jgi:hypothetical protein
MKTYSEPELEVVSIDLDDEVSFGGDNEISAGQLFPSTVADW